MKKMFLLLTVHIAVCSLATAQYAGPGVYAAQPPNIVPPEAINDSIMKSSLANVFLFQNINKITFYYDKAQLEKIRQLEAENRLPELHKALCEYVMQFGIRNFYLDASLTWKLAKLTERLGDPEEAGPLYRLVLRHHYPGIDLREIKWYHDSLIYQMKNRFVSMDYYQHLVEHFDDTDTVNASGRTFLNLGKKINSASADYAPSFSSLNNTLIFTSQRYSSNSTTLSAQNENLYVSTKDENGNWTKAKGLDGINTKYNEGSGCLAADGKTLYFSRCNCPDSFGNCDLYVAHLQEDSTWGEIANLGPVVNSDRWDSHPALSHSGDTLYFTSDREGGFGMADIYFTYKDKKGRWVAPQNLGPVINTKNIDISPFYHPIHDVLYFSSNGQLPGFGEFDIYKAEKKGNNTWAEPVNAGPRINGKGSELYFTIDPKYDLMFFARSDIRRDLSKQDLYSFPLPMEARPEATATLRGSLVDTLTGKPFQGIVAVVDPDKGIEVTPKYLNPDGTFEFDLIPDRDYILVLRGEDFFRIEQPFSMNGPVELRKKATPLDSILTFASINFDFDSASLKESMYSDLDKVVNFLHDNPGYRLEISGHTDAVGSDAYNLDLSKRRAKSIRDYIVCANVAESRVTYEGYGTTRPLVKDTVQKRQAANRRVEFKLYKPEAQEEEEAFYSKNTLVHQKSNDLHQGKNPPPPKSQ